jgi:hypothetical protein
MTRTLTFARETIANLKKSDSFYLYVIVTEDGENHDVWPFHYHEICPGARRDMPKIDESFLRSKLVVLPDTATIVEFHSWTTGPHVMASLRNETA